MLVQHRPSRRRQRLELRGGNPVRLVVADHLRLVVMRALHNPLVDEADHGRLADVGPVREYQPVGACAADARDQRPADLDVARLVRHEGRLVHEVEAQARARHVLVALGEVRPMVDRRRKRALHRVARAVEKLVGLELAAVHAVARDPVEAQADVDPVLPAELDGPVERLQRLGINHHPVLRAGPLPVGEGQPGEIEPPSLHPLEIALPVRVAAAGTGHLGQVEPAPPRDPRLAAPRPQGRAAWKERGRRGGCG